MHKCEKTAITTHFKISEKVLDLGAIRTMATRIETGKESQKSGQEIS